MASGSVGDDLDVGSGMGTSIVQPFLFLQIDWSGVTEISSDTSDTLPLPIPTKSLFLTIPSLFDLFGTSANTFLKILHMNLFFNLFLFMQYI
ncbi:hypothetical protein HCN44_006050 [Aphidius gifuensis]|uniref:Uncharacterized protein n=1 Tax=Aphidius gifuensis TaxID=684658 RepID=A0A834Y5C0_APHGI|nr:hypothetical protein HCN44_006050 [Aphidius gifuensis]